MLAVISPNFQDEPAYPLVELFTVCYQQVNRPLVISLLEVDLLLGLTPGLPNIARSVVRFDGVFRNAELLSFCNSVVGGELKPRRSNWGGAGG